VEYRIRCECYTEAEASPITAVVGSVEECLEREGALKSLYPDVECVAIIF
jgi:hypothetical protein